MSKGRKRPRQEEKERAPNYAIWGAGIAFVGAIGAAVIGNFDKIWPKPQPKPIYEAWLEIQPNPVVRDSPASIKLYFNNGSANRVRLLRMIGWDPCDSTATPTQIDPTFPGWKGSVVDARVSNYIFYAAEHLRFPYSCGVGSDQDATMNYRFDLYFESEGNVTRTVKIEKSVIAIAPRK